MNRNSQAEGNVVSSLPVRAFVRVRPAFDDDVQQPSASSQPAVKSITAGTITDMDDRTYRFDRVMGPETSNGELFAQCGLEALVDGVYERGTNATVMAYGQTASGKTHTLFGSPFASTGTGEEHALASLGTPTMKGSNDLRRDPNNATTAKGQPDSFGIVHLALRRMLELAQLEKDQITGLRLDDPNDPELFEETAASISIVASVIEIYNETVYDLLVSADESDDRQRQRGSQVSANMAVVVDKKKRAAALRPDPAKWDTPAPVSEGAFSTRPPINEAPPPEKPRSAPKSVVAQRVVPVRQDRRRDGFEVPAATRTLENWNDAVELLKAAHVVQSRGSTPLNPRSSRAHTIVRVTVSRQFAENEEHMAGTLVGELNLVDLAGSEPYRHPKAEARLDPEVQRKETVAINQSLNHLKTALVSASRGEVFTGYRNSVLTKVLKRSIGGDAQVAVICTVAAAPTCSRETAATLHFGALSRAVVTRPADGRAQMQAAAAAHRNARAAASTREEQLNRSGEVAAMGSMSESYVSDEDLRDQPYTPTRPIVNDDRVFALQEENAQLHAALAALQGELKRQQQQLQAAEQQPSPQQPAEQQPPASPREKDPHRQAPPAPPPTRDEHSTFFKSEKELSVLTAQLLAYFSKGVPVEVVSTTPAGVSTPPPAALKKTTAGKSVESGEVSQVPLPCRESDVVRLRLDYERGALRIVTPSNVEAGLSPSSAIVSVGTEVYASLAGVVSVVLGSNTKESLNRSVASDRSGGSRLGSPPKADGRMFTILTSMEARWRLGSPQLSDEVATVQKMVDVSQLTLKCLNDDDFEGLQFCLAKLLDEAGSGSTSLVPPAHRSVSSVSVASAVSASSTGLRVRWGVPLAINEQLPEARALSVAERSFCALHHVGISRYFAVKTFVSASVAAGVGVSALQLRVEYGLPLLAADRMCQFMATPDGGSLLYRKTIWMRR